MDALGTALLAHETNREAAWRGTSDLPRSLRPERSCANLLLQAGLKPTRQRLTLASLLFSRGDRHVTAEMLFAEALSANVQLAQATVYNTLNQFVQAGLLRRIDSNGPRSFFDTNTSVHPHFYLEDEDVLIDVPDGIVLDRMPDPLPGHEISRLDVVIRLRRKPTLGGI